MSGLAVEDVSFRYPAATGPALDAVSFAVVPGEVLAVVGPSGSGKSTLLRLLTGLLRPATGRIAIDGADVTGVPPERRPVAMVFQGFALFPHLTVADNVGFGLRVRRVPRAERDRRVAEAAERLGLGALLHRLPGQLSGGERQRVALARALVRDPRVFCLDEPLSSLDPVLRASARRDLDDLLRRSGRCAVYVTHDQSEAMTVGDRVAVVNAGRIEQIAAPRALYDAPETTFVASFVGSPPMNLAAPTPGVLAAAAGALPPGGVPDGGRLGVRPEHVVLEPGEAAEVVEVDELGHEAHVVVTLDGTTVVGRTAPGTPLRPGARTGVAFRRVDVFDAAGRAVR